jgi:DNA-binding NarL/FixJ family response regulator
VPRASRHGPVAYTDAGTHKRSTAVLFRRNARAAGRVCPLAVEDPIRLAVVHGSRLVRDGMSDLLGHEQSVEVVGTFSGATEALVLRPDDDVVLLYDLSTAHEDGAAEVMALQRDRSRVRILFVNVEDDDQAIIECVRAGASGCVLQDATVQDLIAAVRAVRDGAPPASPRVITSLFKYVASLRLDADAPTPEELTPREREILTLMTEGFSNKEIAERLVLQPQTVKNYGHVIMQKLGVHSRLDLIKALRPRRRS